MLDSRAHWGENQPAQGRFSLRIMLRPPLCAQVAVRAYCLLFSLAGCVRERILFEAADAGGSGEVGAAGTAGLGGSEGTSGAGGSFGGATAAGTSGVASAGVAGATGGDGGNAGALAPPWTESSCVGALAAGKNGDPCLEIFKCATSVDCCEILAYCDGKVLNLQTNCTLCPVKCSADSDCSTKELCENYQCRSCPTNPCPEAWRLVLRNDCPVCVPPSECEAAGDPICGQLSCVPGQSCLPGCNADPSCCFGNRCVAPGCSTLKGMDCLVAGCPAGSLCKVAGPATECKCQPSTGTFVCIGNSYNTCNVF